jgi:hypothetical protein
VNEPPELAPVERHPKPKERVVKEYLQVINPHVEEKPQDEIMD